jgi:cytochrome b involved in lipid metabolism
MQSKITGIVFALILVAGIGGYAYYQKQESLDLNPTSAGSESINPGAAGGTFEAGSPESGLSDTPGVSAGAITLAQVAGHNSKASCWAAISGSVYDLTAWIPNHPGGEQAILSLCGKDGTAAFNGQHGNNIKAKAVLAGFKIGALAQ